MKRKLSLIICLVMCVAAFAVIFAACNDKPAGGDEIVLQVWGAEEDQKFLQEVCDAYAAANPDKKYDFLLGKQSESDAADTLLKDAERGADVFAFASDQLNKLIRGGAIARLGGTVLEEVKKNNTEESVAGCTVKINGEDRTYAMPFTDNTFFIYYDKSKFDAADLTTLDGILSKCDAKHQFAIPMQDSWYISSFYFGKDLGYEVVYDEKLSETSITCDFDCQTGLDVTNAVFGYVQNPAMKSNSDDSKLIAGFSDGSIIAGASGLWNAKSIKEILGENFGCAALPTYTLNGQQVPMRPFAGYKCIGVNSHSAHLVEAQKFALFLTNYENQVKRFESRGYSPTNIEAQKLDNIKNDVCVKAIQQQLLCCKPQAGVPTTFWTPIEGLGKAMVANIETPNKFDSQAQLTAAINAITGQTTPEQ